MLTPMITTYTDRNICEVFYDEGHTSKQLTDNKIREYLRETFVAGIDTVNIIIACSLNFSL